MIPQASISAISALIIEMTFFLVCAIFIVWVYFGYYRKRYVARLTQNPKIQKQLDYEFRTLDG
jgi:hypothetical protein